MNLHTLNKRRPHDLIQLMTLETYDDLVEEYRDPDEDEDEDIEIPGVLLDLWEENGKPLGLWVDDDTLTEYVIFVAEYNYGQYGLNEEGGNETFQREVETIRRYARNGNRYSWYLYGSHTLDER